MLQATENVSFSLKQLDVFVIVFEQNFENFAAGRAGIFDFKYPSKTSFSQRLNDPIAILQQYFSSAMATNLGFIVGRICRIGAFGIDAITHGKGGKRFPFL